MEGHIYKHMHTCLRAKEKTKSTGRNQTFIKVTEDSLVVKSNVENGSERFDPKNKLTREGTRKVTPTPYKR